MVVARPSPSVLRAAAMAAIALVALASGRPRSALPALAAAVLGWVVGLQRRVTGGILAPVLIHCTWSLGMLLVLPAVMDRAA